jgi:hypothetical protein
VRFDPNLLGDLIVVRDIAARDLYVNGGGKPEVQDLRSNVGRLEEARHVRELLVDHCPDLPDVIGSRTMLSLLERGQDVAVTTAQSGAVAESQVNATRWQANIVEYGVQFIGGNDLPDFSLDSSEKDFLFLNSRPDRRPNVQTDETGVHRGEKVSAHEEH